MSIESFMRAVLDSEKDADEADIPADENYKEIFRLEQMLLSHNIPYRLRKLWDGWQIGYPDLPESKNIKCSVIQHFGSYGSKDDLLEIKGLTLNGEEVEGWLCAEDVYSRIVNHYLSQIMP